MSFQFTRFTVSPLTALTIGSLSHPVVTKPPSSIITYVTDATLNPTNNRYEIICVVVANEGVFLPSWILNISTNLSPSIDSGGLKLSNVVMKEFIPGTQQYTNTSPLPGTRQITFSFFASSYDPIDNYFAVVLSSPDSTVMFKAKTMAKVIAYDSYAQSTQTTFTLDNLPNQFPIIAFGAESLSYYDPDQRLPYRIVSCTGGGTLSGHTLTFLAPVPADGIQCAKQVKLTQPTSPGVNIVINHLAWVFSFDQDGFALIDKAYSSTVNHNYDSSDSITTGRSLYSISIRVILTNLCTYRKGDGFKIELPFNHYLVTPDSC